MKSFRPMRLNDLDKLNEILSERISGKNRAFFSDNANSLREAWSDYIEKGRLVTEIVSERTPWINKKNTLMNLYPGKEDQVQKHYIDELRATFKSDSYMLCPYCGRPIFDEIDHYLPKSKYPEFSLLSKNMVPSCSDCNGLKDNLIPEGSHEYFLHPYFDHGIDAQVIYFEIVPPFPSPRLELRVISTLNAELCSRINFQIAKLELSERLEKHARTDFRALIEQLGRNEFENMDDLTMYLRRCIRSEFTKYKSENSVASVIYKSILNSQGFLDYLEETYFR